jgi:2-polyprenyl-3-methyl-5-hydroxy-6-metoxy-1,4-benzoquinol methylase
MKRWYETLFDNYGLQYDAESFVHGTIGECDFIEKEIGFNRQACILDIGCGTGRHLIELTKRGYNVTGIDLSESQLRRAHQKASEQNLVLDLRKMDARDMPFSGEFDLAIMICEGAFPLMETDEMNYQILHNGYKSLKSSGKFIFTTLNGLFPLFHSVKEFLSQGSDGSKAICEKSSFDLMTFRDYNVTSFTDDSGHKIEIDCNERYYVPSEVTWMLKSLGFKTIDIFGAKLGAFSRKDMLTTEDFEMLIIAEK